MGLVAKSGGDYEKPPAGNHPAVLVAVVDMGNQWQDGYQGEPGGWQHRAYFVWELVGEPVPGKNNGENHLAAIDLTLSTHKKAKLRQWVEAWTGKPVPDGGLDVTAHLGRSCLLNVAHTEKGHAKVTGVSALPRGMTCPPAHRQPFSWTIEEAAGDPAGVRLPDWLPYFYGKPLAEAVQGCKEFGGTSEGRPGRGKPAHQTAPQGEAIPF